jgi:hypothetical protein
MSGSTDPVKAIFERLVETTEKKARAKGKTIYKPEKKPKRAKKKALN